ncbi:DNA damage-inducible protein 1 [Thecaphora frezii]
MITIVTENDQTFPVDVDASIELENLKALIEADTSIPAASQQLYSNGTLLSDDKKTLSAYGVGSDDLVVLRDTRTAKAVQPNASASNSARSSAKNQGPSASAGLGRAPANEEEAAEQLRHQILADPNSLAQLRANRPDLAEAAASDPNRFLELIRAERNKMAEAHAARLRVEAELAAADEFDIDAQRRIEEAIRQERVMENLEHAMEYSPESFGRVTMLYVDCKVNGTDVKAFVDSGAQATIMSPECAERCGIMRLLDTRFAGIARGVGTAKILGRVHSAQIQLGPTLFLPCSFTIMEGKGVEMLFGLDMLKRYQAAIDLAQNALVIQGNKIRFLDEHELPSEAKMEYGVDENGQPVSAASKSANPGAGALGAAAANANTAAAHAVAKSASFPGSDQSLAGSSGGAAGRPSAAAPVLEQSSRAAPESYGFSFSHTPAASSTTSAPALSASQTAALSSSAPAPAPRTGAGAGAGVSGSSRWPESSVASLMDLGASRVQAIGFLDAAGGNVEVAASLLFQQ